MTSTTHPLTVLPRTRAADIPDRARTDGALGQGAERAAAEADLEMIRCPISGRPIPACCCPLRN